jgi:hypothetical protein
MNELPAGWRLVSVRDIAKEIVGGTVEYPGLRRAS